MRAVAVEELGRKSLFVSSNTYLSSLAEATA